MEFIWFSFGFKKMAKLQSYCIYLKQTFLASNLFINIMYLIQLSIYYPLFRNDENKMAFLVYFDSETYLHYGPNTDGNENYSFR